MGAAHEGNKGAGAPQVVESELGPFPDLDAHDRDVRFASMS
jgi:hypothetical protein